MADIETLTDEERSQMARGFGLDTVAMRKLLRIIDAQAAALAEARAEAQAERDSAKEFARQLREARAEVERLSTERDTFLSGRLARLSYERDAANGLLERASVRLDETNYPEWWKAYRAHLSGQPAAPKPAVYEVWVGTEKTKELIVKETNDIEDAARTACADLSGCTFWGMKSQPAAPSQFALDVIARVGNVTLTDLPESPNEDEP